MKKLVLALILALLLDAPAFALDGDRISHYWTSTVYGIVIGSVTYHISEDMGPGGRALTSSGLAFIPGIVIEISDEFSKGNKFDWGDLLADGLGAVTGAMTAELVNGQFWLAASGRQIRLIGKW